MGNSERKGVLMKLNVKVWALTGGIMWSVYLGAAALFEMLKIKSMLGFSHYTFKLLATVFPGLSGNIMGIILGLIYGLVCGGLIFGIFAWLHNFFAEKLS